MHIRRTVRPNSHALGCAGVCHSLGTFLLRERVVLSHFTPTPTPANDRHPRAQDFQTPLFLSLPLEYPRQHISCINPSLSFQITSLGKGNLQTVLEKIFFFPMSKNFLIFSFIYLFVEKDGHIQTNLNLADKKKIDNNM